MYCPACGAQTEPDDRFCFKCGAPLPQQSKILSSPLLWPWLTGLAVVFVLGVLIWVISRQTTPGKGELRHTPRPTVATVAMIQTPLTKSSSPSIRPSSPTPTTRPRPTATPIPTATRPPTAAPPPTWTTVPTPIPTPLTRCFESRLERFEDFGSLLDEVRGYIYDRQGNGIPNMVIEIYVPGYYDQYHVQFPSTGDGGFHFAGITPGQPYEVHVIGDDIQSIPARFTPEWGGKRAIVFIYEINCP